MWANRAGQRSAIRINPTHTVHRSPLDTAPTMNQDGGQGLGDGEIIAAFQAARRYCFPRSQASSPGLRDNAPLALKECPDYSLGFSISSKARVSITRQGPLYSTESYIWQLLWVARILVLFFQLLNRGFAARMGGEFSQCI